MHRIRAFFTTISMKTNQGKGVSYKTNSLEIIKLKDEVD